MYRNICFLQNQSPTPKTTYNPHYKPFKSTIQIKSATIFIFYVIIFNAFRKHIFPKMHIRSDSFKQKTLRTC